MPSSNNYGTVSPQRQREDADASVSERAGLLGTKPGRRSLGTRLYKHFDANVSTAWGDIALLFCYIVTGLLDSAATYRWGSFVSMQTGNTLYLGLGIAHPREDNRWIRALISIVAFNIGSFFFARYHRYFSSKKRWVIVGSYTIQLLMIVASALMQTFGPPASPKGPITEWVAVPIALIAFQSGGQASISRVLGFGSLTSVVLTSNYVDLHADGKLFAPIRENPERNRRVAAPILLLLGAVIGGLWSNSDIGMEGALWTAVVLKLLVILAWCFWASEKETEE